MFMTEEKALWGEWERGDDFDQGSSSEGVLHLTVSSARVM